MPAKGTTTTRATGGAARPTPTTSADAARIQSTQAKAGGDTTKGSFPARAQAGAARNAAGGAPAAKGAKGKAA
ncbi:hypothetical protein PHLGIDRAFT_120520 [Phlebiopsis gigantea 11061_1 CR5-6]|uniref:SMP domain-containing protein n=1 Tax=Phlebiopsis gigantea (strain 11061_1 CR5-6) TaxID=745531 RepID=A0A0C3PG21_PHLG1|nr:hypothetical protein PHLGIDRAFT_120520 [Phlebiopsis gigantea 11061_1 CR5-6]